MGCLCLVGMGQLLVVFDAERLVGRVEGLVILENIHTLAFGGLGRVSLILLSP